GWGGWRRPAGPWAPPGLPALAPAPDLCAVRFFIERGKSLLLRTERDRLAFESLHETDAVGAAALLPALRDAASNARGALGRLIELVLAHHAIHPPNARPTNPHLRPF